MNTNSKRTAAFVGAFVATALFAGSAVAGGQAHRLPADYGKTSPTYEIRIVNMPSGETAPLTVQVVNKETGQLVTDAEVTMQHRHWLGFKGVPRYRRVQLELKPDGHGDYVCNNGPLLAGDKIVLRAQVPGEPSSTWLRVN